MAGATPSAYEGLAKAFIAEGVDTLFTLLGDGNMHWALSLSQSGKVNIIHVRHEHCAVAAATGYALATRRVGVASVTGGPGFTQIMTALVTAAEGRVPLVIFAGESPIGLPWYLQAINQAPFAAAAGARYIQAHTVPRMMDQVREAFYYAKTERRPVIIGIPYDLQKLPMPIDISAYRPSSTLMPETGRLRPDPMFVDKAAKVISSARHPILIGGRGAISSNASDECEQLMEMCGGLLATTLPARGLFDKNPFSLGIAGGFSSAIAKEMFAKADLVIAVGASMANFTHDGGRLFPTSASVLQVDIHPIGVKDARPVADLYVTGDAKIVLNEIIGQLKQMDMKPAEWRTPALSQRIIEEPSDKTTYPVEAGALDPRRVIAELDRVIPKDWEMVSGSGHNSYFTTQMRGRSPEHYHVLRDFGAIGNGLSFAMGVAAAKRGARVVSFDGDGGLLMHAQEFETIKRHRLKLLVCAMNDGGYGSEFHKFRGEGVEDGIAIFGHCDFASVAKAFGLKGQTITDIRQFEAACRDFADGDIAMVLDIRISQRVTSPSMLRSQKYPPTYPTS